MNQELLNELRKDFKNKKAEIKEHNKKVLRIRELMNDEKVKEYIELVGDNDKQEYLNMNSIQIIDEIYRPYLCKIKNDETNNIYFYLGTYSFYYHYDIDDGGVDKRVNENDPLADYRLYWNIEGLVPIRVPKKDFSQFEKENTIIATYFRSSKDYYYIQKEFFADAVRYDQETAKKRLIKKYGRN